MAAASLTHAQMVRANVVRVRFDAAPKASDSAAVDDALNPARYTVTRVGGGAAPLVARVDKVPDSDVLFDVWLLVGLPALVAFSVTSAGVEAA